MECQLSDSSGTDDDFPPSHQSRFQRPGHVAGNERSAAVGSGPFSRLQNDMETQIHSIEQEAYTSVLRAFKAQSDAITWEMESLITELRKELRVSDEEHRELLSRVNADDIICRIREWRKSCRLQPGTVTPAQHVHDSLPIPTVSASHKKPKTSLSAASLSLGVLSPVVRPSIQPSSLTLRHGPPLGAKTKKPNSKILSSTSSKKPVASGGAITGAGRGKGMTKVQPKKDFTFLQNGIRKKPRGDIEILHTETLIKEVEKVLGAHQPDPTEMEKAKKLLRKHEEALILAIARLEDTSDGETGAVNGPRQKLEGTTI